MRLSLYGQVSNQTRGGKKTLRERAESGLTYRFYAANPYQLFVIQTLVIASPVVDLSRPRRSMSRDLLGNLHSKASRLETLPVAIKHFPAP